jgi:cobalt/nickel transport protein
MKRFYIIGFLTSLFIAAIVSPFACNWEDGFERVVAANGLEPAAGEPAIEAPVPGYVFPYVENEYVSTGFAGAFGASLTFAGLFGFGFLLTRLRKK